MSAPNLEALFAAAAVGMAAADMRRRLIHVNPALERMLGVEPGALNGVDLASLTLPADRHTDDVLFAELLAGVRTHYQTEKRYVRRDGEIVHGRVVVSLVHDEEGAPLYAVGMIEDVTERTLAEARFAGVLAAATEYSIIGTDLNGVITVFNSGAERMLGLRAADVVGRCTPELFHDASEVRRVAHELGMEPGFEVFVHAARRGAAETREWSYVRPDGSALPVELTVTAVADPGGLPSGFIGIARDLSAQRKAERALKESEARLTLALEGSRAGMWDWNVTSGATFFSPGWYTMLGYTPGTVEPHIESCRRLTHPDDLPQVERAFDAHVHGDAGYVEAVHRFRAADGGWRWILVRGRIVQRGADGRPLRMVGTHADLTELRETELALRRSEERYRELVDSAEDLIQSLDGTGRLVYANPAWERAVGYTLDEFRGRSLFDILDPAERDHCASVLRAVTAGEHVRGVRTVLRGREGERVVVEGNVNVRLGPDGSPITQAIFRDITDREEAERRRAEMVGVVTHELRTPLTSIKGSLDMLTSGVVDPGTSQGMRMLTLAQRGVDRLVRLVNDLLEAERLEASPADLRYEPVAVDALVQSALESVESLAAGAGVLLSGSSCQGSCWADGDRVVQVLVNLVGNAIKFSPAGGTVTVSADEREGMCVFSVRDQGRGIPAHLRESVFGRFRQVDVEDRRRGSGLGLSIARALVEQHGGRIWVTDGEGGGSDFCFTLPAAAPLPPAGL
jgi:PAS domain S-box-containing protein